jgi:hypothetical protein
MTHRHTAARWTAIALLALGVGACATAQRPDPEPIVDNQTSDAEALAPEFHNAAVGHDHLRGPLPTE